MAHQFPDPRTSALFEYKQVPGHGAYQRAEAMDGMPKQVESWLMESTTGSRYASQRGLAFVREWKEYDIKYFGYE